jgi:flavorubredoxin
MKSLSSAEAPRGDWKEVLKNRCSQRTKAKILFSFRIFACVRCEQRFFKTPFQSPLGDSAEERDMKYLPKFIPLLVTLLEKVSQKLSAIFI